MTDKIFVLFDEDTRRCKRISPENALELYEDYLNDVTKCILDGVSNEIVTRASARQNAESAREFITMKHAASLSVILEGSKILIVVNPELD